MPRCQTRITSPGLPAAMLPFCCGSTASEFYAVGDPRTRWRALWALVGLAVADIIIGFAYISVASGLQADYTLRSGCSR